MKSIKLIAATAIIMITVYCSANNIDDVNGNTNKVAGIYKAVINKLQRPINRYTINSENYAGELLPVFETTAKK